jgi:hypothetical protein
MSTTKTKPDHAAEVEAIDKQLEAAREERNRLGTEALAWVAEGDQLNSELNELARSDPSQFANGFPRPETRAAELKREIDKRLGDNQWPAILEGSDERIRQLEAELHRVIEESADELARREYLSNGKAATLKLRRAATVLLEGAEEYRASTTRQGHIAHAVGGLDARDVWHDPVVEEAVAFAQRLADLQPPRPVSLVPLTTEEPPRVRAHAGGYIGQHSARRNASEDQPQRVEAL